VSVWVANQSVVGQERWGCGVCWPGRRVWASPGMFAWSLGFCAVRRVLANTPTPREEAFLGL